MQVDTPEGMAAAKVWLTTFLAGIGDQAAWLIPRSNALYWIDKPSLTVTRDDPAEFDEPTEMVFVELGYTVNKE